MATGAGEQERFQYSQLAAVFTYVTTPKLMMTLVRNESLFTFEDPRTEVALDRNSFDSVLLELVKDEALSSSEPVGKTRRKVMKGSESGDGTTKRVREARPGREKEGEMGRLDSHKRTVRAMLPRPPFSVHCSIVMRQRPAVSEHASAVPTL